MRVVAVVGNPKRGGRTTTVAERVATRMASTASGTVEVLELSDIAPELFSPTAPAVGEWTDRVRSADAAVFASPTYKAGLTGLLKAFLDCYDTKGLYVVDSEIDDRTLDSWWSLAEPALRPWLSKTPIA
ncbi:MAG: NAD(P)H-dependent oxidoreductase [Acidimicrobiia bacterium]